MSNFDGSKRTALVTGATGFIGSNLVPRLLASGRDRVICLVRPGEDVDARLHRSLEESAAAAGLADGPEGRLELVEALAGEVTKADVGLGAEALAALSADPPDEVWHCAASLRYLDRDRDQILATNVDGTRNMLALADRLGIGDFNLVSTAYVAGSRNGSIPEHAYDGSFAANNWYEESKRRGEDLALEAARAGMRVRILRPSIVVGSLSTFDCTSTSGFYGFIAGLNAFLTALKAESPGFFDTRSLRMFREPGTHIDLIPIDALTREALEIVDGPGADGGIWHLTNPFPIDLPLAQRAVERCLGGAHGEWVEDPGKLEGPDLIWDGAIDFYKPYLQADKRFERRRDEGSPPEQLRISEDDLRKMTEKHLERSALIGSM